MNKARLSKIYDAHDYILMLPCAFKRFRICYNQNLSIRFLEFQHCFDRTS